MPDTSLGITYPSSTSHTRIWEHVQEVANDVNGVLVSRNPLYGTAKLTSQYTLTTTITDLGGCSLTINCPTSNAVALISYTADCQCYGAASSILAVISVSIDGADQASPQAVWGPGNQAAQVNTRGPATNSMTALLSGSGNHTIKLRAAASSGTGEIRLNASHTQLSVLVLPF